MTKKLILIASLFVIFTTTIFIVNQTAQVVSLAGTIHPVFGRAVLLLLIAIYAFVIAVPGIAMLRLPKGMIAPPDENSDEYRNYLRCLGARLTCNPNVSCTTPLDRRDSIESAIATLDVKADAIINETAARLFVSTAISQNGRLDALMVLVEQSRLIYRIAHIYNQRPTLQEFARLYSNVGVTLFAARQLDDPNIREQIQPVFNAVLGHAAVSLVPGVTPVASIILNSLLDGTANAFLTLRVGLICRNYCRCITTVDQNVIRRNASVAAAGMLGSIVLSSAASVSKAMMGAAKRAGEATVESATSGVRKVGAKLNPFKGTTATNS
jgi:hypothetical protein